MADFGFQTLTPDTILDAIEQVGVFPASGLLALNSYENRVYQFLDDDRKRYVVKFYRPERWSTAQIQEEHDFLDELAEHDIPVVAPLRFDGRSILEYGGYRFTLFPSVGGRALEADNLDQLEEFGRQLGRIHQVGRAKPFVHRPALVSTAVIDDARQELLQCPLLPTGLKTAFQAIIEPVSDRLKRVPWEKMNTIRLHGDCHVGNLLIRDDGLTLVDLDDCRQGPAVQDMWMMLSGDRLQQQQQLTTLLEAYEEFTEFDTFELRLIEPLRTFRIIQYMAWLARRWVDPAFSRSFSWFAEERYWEQQILALKEQLSALDEPPLKLQPY
ncbi:serine/threonine protein kinase [Aliidiomarina celeris]|uniref:serine/threonine protein kinase n=1 Tax=Aliidiomarina celeris TaxID=2249428 RepID=UPI000DEBEEC4|nr:serine/threonine protein kinase [Aliidiomarina celeris]